MTTNRTKKDSDWMRYTQFVIFSVSCVVGLVIWYYAQEDKAAIRIQENYVNKIELQLVDQKVKTLEESHKNLKYEFGTRLEKMEDTNNEIVNLITDIRLTLAAWPMEKD